MATPITYRGKTVTGEDVAFIRTLIAEHPKASRRALSRMLCEAWGWVQANGELRDVVCRGLLLQLHRSGDVELPAAKWAPKAPAKRRIPTAVAVDNSEFEGSLSDLGPLELRQVRRSPKEAVVNGLIEKHHYLGYSQPVGEHLKYLVVASDRPVACFVWSSAPRHLGPRDRHIGWSQAERKANIRYVAYQSRFLIMPWIRVPYLASHLLGRMSRQLSADWQRVYAHPVYFCETFVESPRYRGTCYRAANWTFLGRTTGRGKDAPTHLPTRSIKDIYGYPLVRDFRRRLGTVVNDAE